MWLDSPSAGEIRQHAHDILQRSEFQRQESLLDRFFGWLGDLFSNITFGLGGGPGFLGNLVAIAILAGIVVLLVLLVRALLGRTRLPTPDADDELTIELEDGREAIDWRRDAEQFEAAGQWREAMRARYRELVRSLIEDGVLDDVPGRTTGEYRGEFVDARAAHAAPFIELTEIFEAVWYGGLDTDAADNKRFRELADAARRRETVGV
ncbi:MAG: hypothetical protein QOD92_1709 [Acidimicrobiaceae bacterium]